MKAISLFSGMGGDSLGLKQAGFNVIAYSEFNKAAIKTHDANFPGATLIGKSVGGDITKVSDEEFEKYKGDVDLIFAGFPCQGFSNAGKKKENDPRNTLFKEFLRATRIIQPTYIMGENVKGLTSRKTSDGENYIDVITEEFKKLDYDIEYRVLDCSKFGVPQKRERLFILGRKSSTCTGINWPKADKKKTDLTSIVSFSMEGTVSVDSELVEQLDVNEQSIIRNLDDFSEGSSPHPYLLSKLNADDDKLSYAGKDYDMLFSFGKRVSPIHCEVVNVLNPSKTIICSYDHQPRFFVLQENGKGYFLRSFTVDELKQIQSFPKSFKVLGSTKEQIVQIGNAVPPSMVRQLAQALIASEEQS